MSASRLTIAKNTFKLKPAVPENLKGGRLEKIGNYFYNIFDDYRIVFKEVLQDCRDRPLKASFYGSLLTCGFVMLRTNPSAQSFNAQVIESSNTLSTVGEPIRNPNSDNHVTMISTAMKDKRLKIRNLKFLTLVFMNDFPTDCGLFEANCSQVKPHWTEWYKAVVDIGIFGKWIYLDKTMKDYDINPDEWLPDGQPKIKRSLLPPDE